MPVDFSNVTIGEATKQDDYVRLRDTIREAAGAIAGTGTELGGSLKDFVEVTSAADLPDGWEREIDGTHLASCEVYLEVMVVRGPDSLGGTVTVTVDLWNVTAGSLVASSAVAVALTTTTRTHAKSSALTLPTSLARFKARARVDDAAKPCAVVARVVIRGS
jgi:hypothetical protein